MDEDLPEIYFRKVYMNLLLSSHSENRKRIHHKFNATNLEECINKFQQEQQIVKKRYRINIFLYKSCTISFFSFIMRNFSFYFIMRNFSLVEKVPTIYYLSIHPNTHTQISFFHVLIWWSLARAKHIIQLQWNGPPFVTFFKLCLDSVSYFIHNI